VTEPWRATARRTGAIALVVGASVGVYERRLGVVPTATAIALWFTLGGHFVEVVLRDHLVDRLEGRGFVQAAVRVVAWFAGGSILYAGALMTRVLLTGDHAVRWPWWAGGAAFIALELFVHLVLYARGHASVYDGRG
jgi:hypothetical protein